MIAVLPTCRVRGLVYLVTRKLVRFTKYAVAELTTSRGIISQSFFAWLMAMPSALSSISSVAGTSSTTQMGAMYSSRF